MREQGDQLRHKIVATLSNALQQREDFSTLIGDRFKLKDSPISGATSRAGPSPSTSGPGRGFRPSAPDWSLTPPLPPSRR